MGLHKVCGQPICMVVGGWGCGGGHEEISRRPKPKVVEGGGGKCVLMDSNKYSTNLKSQRL